MGKIRVTETRIQFDENGKPKRAIGKTFIEKEPEIAEPHSINLLIASQVIEPGKKQFLIDTIDIELEKEKNDLERKEKRLQIIEKTAPIVTTVAAVIGWVAGIILAIWITLTTHGSTTTIIETLLATLVYVVASIVLGTICGVISHALFNNKKQKFLRARKSLRGIITHLEKSRKLIESLS